MQYVISNAISSIVIARVHPKVLGHNADMTYLLKINNLRNYVIGRRNGEAIHAVRFFWIASLCSQ
jgi:hypothetical protein